jgi:hypothetical protein
LLSLLVSTHPALAQHVWLPVHVHMMLCPQLFVAGPHPTLMHAVVLSGGQQVWFARQTPALGHVAEHITVCPHLFVTVALHLPAQTVSLSGVQQLLLTQTSLDDAQLTVPAVPQDTDCPQLFVAVPHVWPWHVIDTGSGTQPHAPLVHVRPPSQPPHMIICPQSSVDGPQRFWHQVDGGVGAQHELLAVQTPPFGQVAGQRTI